MRIKLTEKEKELALDAASAAEKLIHVWGFLHQDRANDNDLRDARKYTETLVTFGRMVEEKLQLEEVLPKPVEAPDPRKECGNDTCHGGHDPVEKLLADKTVLDRIKRLFR